MQREITIKPRIVALGILAFIVLVAAVVILLWPSGTSLSAVNATGVAPLTAAAVHTTVQATAGYATVRSPLDTPEKAAVAFAKAFYAVSYTDYEGWLSGLKAVSTEEGYLITEHTLAPSVWPAIEQAQTVTPTEAVQAEDKGLVLQGHSEIGGDWQIREVQVTIDPAHLWPSMTQPTFNAFLLLGQESGEWRFVSFMTQKQIDELKKGAAQAWN